MTVEELRDEFGNSGGLEGLAFFYPQTAWSAYSDKYVEWLEQKITQPCPECEKHKRAVERLTAQLSKSVKK